MEYDIITGLTEWGMQDVLEYLMTNFITPYTAFKMCQVLYDSTGCLSSCFCRCLHHGVQLLTLNMYGNSTA